MIENNGSQSRVPEPIYLVGRYQRLRVIFAIACVSVALGLLLWGA